MTLRRCAALLLLAAACADRDAGTRSEPLSVALAEALLLDDPLLRAERIAVALRGLDAEGAETALDLVERSAVRVEAEDAALVAIAAARIEPALALDRLRPWPLRLRERALAAVIEDQAKSDPAATAAVLRERPSLDQTPALVRGWAARDPEAALRFVAERPAGAARVREVRALAEALLRRVPGGGAGTGVDMRWLEPWLERDELRAPVRRELLVAAVGLSASIDPVGTASWLAPRVGAPEAVGAVAALAAEWSQLDPPGAAAWLGSLAPSAERDAARRELLQQWFARDPQEAQRWRAESERSERADASAGRGPR